MKIEHGFLSSGFTGHPKNVDACAVDIYTMYDAHPPWQYRQWADGERTWRIYKGVTVNESDVPAEVREAIIRFAILKKIGCTQETT